jgi:type IV secretion system protein TrbL
MVAARTCRIACVAAVLGLSLVPHISLAQGVGAQAVDAILQDFKNATNGWETTLQRLAQSTFGVLALLQLAWSFGKLALQRADIDAFVSCLVREIMLLGLFYWLLIETATWAPAIINSFRQAAGAAGGGPVTPGDVLDAGINLAGRIMEAMSMLSPAASVGLMIAGLVMAAAFAWIVATMVLIIIESYVVIGAGVLFMAFGGTAFTNDIAIGVVRTVFAIGAKLFAVQLIAALGTTIVTGWVNKFHDVTSKSIVLEICVALIFAVIVRSVPNLVERMAGGSGLGAHAGALFGTTAAAVGLGALAVRGAASATTSAVGAGAAVTAGGRAANRQIAAGNSGSMIGLTVRNVAGAAGRDIGRRLSGQSPGEGYMGFRVASDIRQRQP